MALLVFEPARKVNASELGNSPGIDSSIFRSLGRDKLQAINLLALSTTLLTVTVMSWRAGRAPATLGIRLLSLGLTAPACSGSSGAPAPAALASLELAEGELNPTFSPENTEYRAELGLLAHTAELRAEASDAQATLTLDAGKEATGQLSESLELELGENLVTIAVDGSKGRSRTYSLTIERRPEPWQRVLALTAEQPVEDGFFGDYLRSFGDTLYVNSSRRGQLYRRVGNEWRFERLSETLFSVELEWMYEAAISADALAVVAQPVGGTETLFAFRWQDGSWVPAGEFETGTQGTVRIWGDDLVFVSTTGVSFFRRDANEYQPTQSLPAPAEDIGFGDRPTYFDAPGVDLGEDVLIVAAPGDSSPATGVDGSPEQDCSSDGALCAFRSGAVFVYERSSGDWEQTAYLKPPVAAAELEFGTTAVLQDDRIVVGCPHESGSGQGRSTALTASVCPEVSEDCLPESGAVYVYARETGKWRPKSMLKASVPSAHDYFGDTLLLSGDALLVGAPGQDSAAGATLDDQSSEDSGGVFAFVLDGDGFRELGLYKLVDEAVSFPFPATLEQARSQLLVASNEAPFHEVSGGDLANAGRVYFLY